MGADRSARARFRDHAYFDDAADFGALYDPRSFDPDHDTLPIAYFEPMLRRVFAAPKWTGYGA